MIVIREATGSRGYSRLPRGDTQLESGLQPRFYRGDYRQDARTAEHLGVRKFWIVGHFMPEGPRNTDKAEIKYWELEPGPTRRPTKLSTVFECTLILEGRINGQIDGQPVELAAGDYIVIPPGVVSNVLQMVCEKSAGLTMKAPSIPGSKIRYTEEESRVSVSAALDSAPVGPSAAFARVPSHTRGDRPALRSRPPQSEASRAVCVQPQYSGHHEDSGNPGIHSLLLPSDRSVAGE